MKNTKLIPLTLAATLLIAQCAFAQVSDIATSGGPISHETCSALVKKYEASGRVIPGHMYGGKMLREILSQPNTAGIIIFVGLDGNGAEHLIFKTLNEEGNISNPSFAANIGTPCPPYCPKRNISEIGGQIEEGLAQQMIDKFQSTYADRVYATSFGRSAMETALNQKDVAGIYFANGLDENNAEHLILVGVQENGVIMWDGYVANDGKHCPPMCPTGKYPQVNSAAVKK